MRIEGKYSSAEVFTVNNKETAIDQYAIAQLQMLCDNLVSKDSVIKVMPDVHPGKVCTIGLTMTVGNSIMPQVVGIDIGCGMTISQIRTKKIEYQKLDTVIRDNVPSGFAVRKKPHLKADDFDLSSLKCIKHIREENALKSLGTLGGGNHFIEVGKDEDSNFYVNIHSGSRNLGKEVTEYYMKEGQKILKEQNLEVPYELTYLTDELKNDYIHDLNIVQDFANLNRQIMIDELVKGMKWKVIDQINCIHNYIDCRKETVDILSSPVLRKGAISALKDEDVIIPINMRDGIILGKGKGNKNWNCSAPHGSGRILKRVDIKGKYTVDTTHLEKADNWFEQVKTLAKGFAENAEHLRERSVLEGLLAQIDAYALGDISDAYRRNDIDEIQEAISETVSIEKIIKPVYNFKAGAED